MRKVNTPKLKRNPSGKTKPKAIQKANPTPPADRQYPWGNQVNTRRGGR